MSKEVRHTGAYAIIPATVRYDNTLSDKAKILYGEISALMQIDGNGYCWATNAHFAKLFDVSEKTIKRAVSELVDKGYVKRSILYEDDGKTVKARYLRALLDLYSNHLGTNLTPSRNKSDPTPGDKSDPYNNHSINNHKEDIPPISPNGERGKGKDPFKAVSAPALKEALAEFAEMRKAIKHPLTTAQSRTRLLNKLRKLAGDSVSKQIAILHQSIDHSWQDVYEIKKQNQQATASQQKSWRQGRTVQDMYSELEAYMNGGGQDGNDTRAEYGEGISGELIFVPPKQD